MHAGAHTALLGLHALFLHRRSDPLMPTVQISHTLTFFHGTEANVVVHKRFKPKLTMLKPEKETLRLLRAHLF